MLKISFLTAVWMLLTSAFMLLPACGEDSTEPVGPVQQDEKPADAGLVRQERLEDGSVMLTTGEIFRAETYCWYKDGVQVENTASPAYLATESGMYKVAGVNGAGEGRPSVEVEVVIGSEALLAGFEIEVKSEALTAWSVLFDIRPVDPEKTYYYDIISKGRWEQTNLKTLQAEIEESARALGEMTDTPYEEVMAGMLQRGDLLNSYNGAGFRGDEDYYIYAFYWDVEKGPSTKVALAPFRTPAPQASAESFSITFEEVTPYSMQVVCEPSTGISDYYLYFEQTATIDAMFASLEDENAYLSYHAMNVGTHYVDMQRILRQGLKPEVSYTMLVMAIDNLGNRFVERAEQVTPAEDQGTLVESELFAKLPGEWSGVQTINDPYSGTTVSEFTVSIVSQVEDLDYDFRAKNQLVALVDGWNGLRYYGIADLAKEYEGLEDAKDPVEAYGPKWIFNVAEGDKVTLDGQARHSVIGWMFMGDCFMASGNAEQMAAYLTEDLQVTLSEECTQITISSPMSGCYPSLAYYFEGFGWMAYFYGGSDIVLTRK